MKAGDLVVLVTDAGTPGLSDPGYRLVRSCIDAGIGIEAVPGPSAAVTALTLSGLPVDRFVFEGFLPRRTSERRRRLEQLADETRTLVFYESTHRLAKSLADCAELLGDRPAVVARELTKLHQEIKRDTLDALARWALRESPRGEMVVIVGGTDGRRTETPDPEVLAAAARVLMEAGVDRRSALTRVARRYEVARREVFDALVETKDGDPS
jgi:16S rRNA (cytidine1402-2'-O)-methyltransferase